MADRKKKATSSKKKTTKSAKSAKKNTGSRKKTQDTGFIRGEVVLILFFALAVLLFLSNFHLIGSVGDVLRKWQLGMFGTPGYIFPLCLFVGMAFAVSNKGNFAAYGKLTAAAAAFCVISAFCEFFFGGTAQAEGVFACYAASSLSGRGGGLVGGAIVAPLSSLIGGVGTVVILIVVFVICAVVITERSFVNAVRRGGGSVYHRAREDYDRYREDRDERREAKEEESAREGARTRGVDLGATDLAAAAAEKAAKEAKEAAEKAEAAAREATAALKAGSRQAAGGTVTEEENTCHDPAEEPAAKGADVFSGTITYPAQIDEDEPPFDESYEVNPAEEAQQVVEEGITTSSQQVGWNSGEEREVPASEFDDGDEASSVPAEGRTYPTNAYEPEEEEDIYLGPEEEESDGEPAGEEEGYDKTTESGSAFHVQGGERRVVTANGKVIETETETLEKKLEKDRKEAKEASGEAAVTEEITQQEALPKREYKFPPLKLLKQGPRNAGPHSDQEYRDTAVKLQQTLKTFGVDVTVTNISCGPTVTRYELHPEMGVKVSKVVSLSDDIKLSLAAEDIRIEAPIPGKSAIGIEVPNKETNLVYLRDLLESDAFKDHTSRLAFAVGKDISGQPVVTDIGKMPHLLIAGATGSGKSVCINTLIMSIIYKAKPDEVRLILIDPKVVELSVYNGIPHLLIPVVTDPKKAAGALNWAVAEMTDRYNKFAQCGVRDLKGYNARVEALPQTDEEEKPEKMSQIVIIIDELADLMMVASSEVEDAICRLAQLARACGIHLVIATQRPSVNVITGLIKANIPSRIAFAVSSGVDSRTILDMNGAEKLLGKGDMLFYPAGYPKPQRVQGAFVSDHEVQAVVDFLTKQTPGGDYNTEIEKKMESQSGAGGASSGGGSGRDDYFADAGRFIIEKDKASIGMLQRMFKIGFNRAARIMDQLAEAGVVSEDEGTKARRVLMTLQEFEDLLNS